MNKGAAKTHKSNVATKKPSARSGKPVGPTSMKALKSNTKAGGKKR